ncbi:MAG: OsmC family protein [Candidatus Aminicenantales bacterium]
MEEKIMRVTFPGGVKVDADYKGYVIRTDQPVYAGGEGSAPAPFDLFLASLATCAGFYVFAFCRKRQIPTEKLLVYLKTERNPETKMVGKISLEIILPQGFPEKYKNAVIRAADTCAVKAHMLNPPAFEISARFSSGQDCS